MVVENCNIFFPSCFQSFLCFYAENKKLKLYTMTAYKNWHFNLLTCSEETFYCCNDTILMKCIPVSFCSMLEKLTDFKLID